jgi:hypothetical protein
MNINLKDHKNFGSINLKNRSVGLKNSFVKFIKRYGLPKSNMDKRKEVQTNTDRQKDSK